jgi:hypothetical protein
MAARLSSGSERTHAAVSAATIRCSPSQLRSLRTKEREKRRRRREEENESERGERERERASKGSVTNQARAHIHSTHT